MGRGGKRRGAGRKFGSLEGCGKNYKSTKFLQKPSVNVLKNMLLHESTKSVLSKYVNLELLKDLLCGNCSKTEAIVLFTELNKKLSLGYSSINYLDGFPNCYLKKKEFILSVKFEKNSRNYSHKNSTTYSILLCLIDDAVEDISDVKVYSIIDLLLHYIINSEEVSYFLK